MKEKQNWDIYLATGFQWMRGFGAGFRVLHVWKQCTRQIGIFISIINFEVSFQVVGQRPCDGSCMKGESNGKT